MAAGSIPKPGTKYGPCVTPCIHRDCASSREIATGQCALCHCLIGYDRAFYSQDQGYVHASCLETQIEQEQAA